jgi:hypothetical protein
MAAQKTSLLAFVFFNCKYNPWSNDLHPKETYLPLILQTVTLLVAGQGTQFITGACTSDADCASSCCGFNSGKCAGPVIAQERDGGCGFGDAQPNNQAEIAFRASQAAAAGQAPSTIPTVVVVPITVAAGQAPSTMATIVVKPTTAAGTGSGKPLGTQFITGACASDAECASSCCGFNSGKCAGPIIAQERDGGCGFGDAQPNDIAAQKLTGAQ